MAGTAALSVSVLMPAHNAGRYIRDAIESVLAQDHSGFELLVCDDASTDGTGAIARALARRDPRLRVVANRCRQGSARSRNRLLGLARGAYLQPCDADDLLMAGSMRALADHLDRHPRTGVVYSAVLRVAVGAREQVVRAPDVIERPSVAGWDLVENPANHGGSMMRTALVRRVGGYPAEIAGAPSSLIDDWALFVRLAEITRFDFLPGRVSYVWRTHPRSQSRRPPSLGLLAAMIRDATRRRRAADLRS